MGTIDSAWFYEKLAEKGSSLRDMARFMELDPSAVSRMLNGERKMSAEEQDRISAFLGLDLNEVAAHRRGEMGGLSERKQAAYELRLPPPERPVKMFTEADIIYKDGKRWMEKDDGTLIELHPAYGCMKGTMTIPPDLDLTAPVDPDWGKVYEDD
ncbi:helix-turn-helix domain-containing protein [Neorhizobium galegae]|uniref:helix-turn-helix domain-containing protein n=1 Tax=Neorhizobium galegae TaxID=399 RepID=UPI000621ACBE|nr:helix-turn-helix transcriptional regulator [Neorhizobium galegae]KAB1124871.1 helix-turn-helix transcriptional regulator [Neorhizobium galegae]MCQ1806262.1 helix-turn-helix transcriptional regulator [Neorhizobium galegae]CDZ58343.1 Plasmid maintenance system antidote protein [Neorhizobium galegae bv. orientalis]CDZ73373.1 Plasmid maintenance system antidote protein [Neorhizobium galegae bv. orientalis]